MLPLDLLGVPFPRAVHVRVEMPRVRPPMIRIKACQTKGFQQRFKAAEHLVLPTPKNIGQHGTRVVIDRRVPQPAGLPLLPTNDHISSISASPLAQCPRQLVPVQRAQQRRVHRRKQRFFFLSSLRTVSVLIRRTRAVSRMPLALRLMSMIVCFTSGKHPRLR